VPRRNSETVSNAIIDVLHPFPNHQLKSITHYVGGVVAEEMLGLPAYFCEPHCPWQRGKIENGNNRLGIDLPRKSKLENYTDKDIQDLKRVAFNCLHKLRQRRS